MYVERNIEARSRNHCCRKRSNKYHTLGVCVCILRYPACKAHDVLKTLLNIKCVWIFCITFVENVSHSKKNSARYRKCT
jgi:hypothetical protein